MGTKITHQEAMRIARETLETAEQERIEVARAEARRGVQYDETQQTDTQPPVPGTRLPVVQGVAVAMET